MYSKVIMIIIYRHIIYYLLIHLLSKIKYVLNNVRLLNLFKHYHDDNISAYNLLFTDSYLINPSNNIMTVLKMIVYIIIIFLYPLINIYI